MFWILVTQLPQWYLCNPITLSKTRNWCWHNTIPTDFKLYLFINYLTDLIGVLSRSSYHKLCNSWPKELQLSSMRTANNLHVRNFRDDIPLSWGSRYDFPQEAERTLPWELCVGHEHIQNTLLGDILFFIFLSKCSCNHDGDKSSWPTCHKK